MATEFEGQWLSGQYLIQKVLGVGSFGCVFSADEYVGGRNVRTVAIKVQQPGVFGTARILDELVASTKLRHPGIVDAFSPGEASLKSSRGEHRVFFLAMEKADGTLHDRLSQGLLKAQEALELARQVAEALQFIHSQRLVHRDIKPSNILWAAGRWKISDLGVARELVSEHTEEGFVGGSLVSNAPEVFEGKLSTKSDLWSLGVTLLYATVGQLPYTAQNRAEWLSLIKVLDPQIPAGIPEPLNSIIRGLLVRDRSARWSTDQVIESTGTQPSLIGPSPLLVLGPNQVDELLAALTESDSGARIGLLPGVYRGIRVKAKTPFELVGLGAPADVVLTGATMPLILIQTSGVRLHNLTLEAPQGSGGIGDAIVDVRSGPCEIESCEVIGGGIGVRASGKQANVTIRRSRVIGGMHAGVQFDQDASGLVDHCEVDGRQTSGLVIRDGGNPMICRSTIRNAGLLRTVMLAEDAKGHFDACQLISMGKLVVEVLRKSETIFARCKIKTTGAKAVRAGSQSKAVFFKCDVSATDEDPWQLAKGHQIQRT